MTCKKCGKQLSPYAYMCGCGEKVTAEEWGVIQIETTGLDVMKDEILRIVILDRHGTAVLNRLYRPRTVTTWEEAQKINHINPRNVAECPVLTEKEVKMISDRYLSRFTTLVTNTSKFTRSFLIAAGFEFPRLVGISGLFESYLEENQKVYFSSGLNVCAEYFGYSKYGPRDDFNRLEKAKKIWFCYQNLKFDIICKIINLRRSDPPRLSDTSALRRWAAEFLFKNLYAQQTTGCETLIPVQVWEKGCRQESPGFSQGEYQRIVGCEPFDTAFSCVNYK